ncbi:MAG TPA: DUF5989 family protein [Pirellulales bacterium]|jgi:hypothetical protein|nr:DUF5989 family protein [Pirellulales bacterium]
MSDEPSNDFERLARDEQAGGVWRELGGFLWENKSWWLMPIVLALALLGMLIALAGSAAAPLLYPFL